MLSPCYHTNQLNNYQARVDADDARDTFVAELQAQIERTIAANQTYHCADGLRYTAQDVLDRCGCDEYHAALLQIATARTPAQTTVALDLFRSVYQSELAELAHDIAQSEAGV